MLCVPTVWKVKGEVSARVQDRLASKARRVARATWASRFRSRIAHADQKQVHASRQRTALSLVVHAAAAAAAAAHVRAPDLATLYLYRGSGA